MTFVGICRCHCSTSCTPKPSWLQMD